uniref:Putative ovule protein n=1 Tax=Solanum chacoense TaxID=4108 RepID=A0A0V0GTF3_SOLCH
MDINKRMIIREKNELYNNIPNAIPQVGSAEGKMHADLTSTFMGVERLFPIDSRLKRKEELEARL